MSFRGTAINSNICTNIKTNTHNTVKYLRIHVTYPYEPGSLVLGLQQVHFLQVHLHIQGLDGQPHRPAGGRRLVQVELGAQPRHVSRRNNFG